jgi:hypothetical protein
MGYSVDAQIVVYYDFIVLLISSVSFLGEVNDLGHVFTD